MAAYAPSSTAPLRLAACEDEESIDAAKLLPNVNFEQLIRMMVDADVARVGANRNQVEAPR